MSDTRAPRPASGAAGVAREWAGALGRLLLFGILLGVIALPLTFAGVALLPAGGAAPWAQQGIVGTVAALGAGAIVLRFVDHRSPRALGLRFDRGALREGAVGLVFGLAMIASALLLMLLSGDVRFAAQQGNWSAALGTLAVSFLVLAAAAAAEEAIYRGYPLQVLVRAGGVPLALLSTNVAFAAAHAQNAGIGGVGFTNIFLAGVLLAVVFLRSGSLWAATGVHLGWNWGMAGLFDLPVSGIDEPWLDVETFEPVLHGPAWWHGGHFGPEGGVIGTIVFVLATVIALRSSWFARRALAPEDRLLCDETLNAEG